MEESGCRVKYPIRYTRAMAEEFSLLHLINSRLLSLMVSQRSRSCSRGLSIHYFRWRQDISYQMLDTGYWMLDTGCWISDSEYGNLGPTIEYPARLSLNCKR